MVLTFESVDEILWCDHSNETSLPVFSDMVLFVFQHSTKRNLKNFVRNLTLATFGSKRVKSLKHIRLTCR